MAQTSTNNYILPTTPNWGYILMRLPFIYVAALVSSISVTMFLIPGDIVAGGVSGIGILLNATLNLPIGLVVLLGNVVMLSIGYRHLGGWNTVIITVIFVVFYSMNLELAQLFVPENGISSDRLLNAVYAGIVGGIAGGMIYRIGGTMGGSSVISRILNTRFGVPTSTAYLYVDSVIIISSGFVFGWEAPLFSLIVLIVDGFVADYVLEGPSLIRTATIITDKPEELSLAIMAGIRRGVTSWSGTGRYTHESHEILFVTIGRSQVVDLKRVVDEIDPEAFVVIGQGHVAYGYGFQNKRAGKLKPLPSIREAIHSDTQEIPELPQS